MLTGLQHGGKPVQGLGVGRCAHHVGIQQADYLYRVGYLRTQTRVQGQRHQLGFTEIELIEVMQINADIRLDLNGLGTKDRPQSFQHHARMALMTYSAPRPRLFFSASTMARI